MYFNYNGIQMILLKTNSVNIGPEHSPDGVDYLWNRWAIDVTCLFAPGATAATSGGQVFQYNRLAPVYADITLQSLKDILSVPRRPLVWFGDNAIVLQSPGEVDGIQNTVDARGDGPKVMGVSVYQIVGSRAFYVRWRGETCVSDCIPLSPLVSNRWSQSHSVDEDLYTTVLTEGVAIFRMDWIEAFNIANNVSVGADFFRDIILPPTPLNFKRADTSVQVNPIGNIVTWRVVDREQPINLGSLANGNNPWGMTRFSGVYHQATVPAGGTGPGGITITGPMLRHSLHATAWGHSRTRKINLLSFLAQLAIEKLNIPVPGLAPLDKGGLPVIQGIEVAEPLAEKHMSIRVDAITPPVSGTKTRGLGVITPLSPYGNQWLGVDDIQTIVQYEQYTGTNPNPAWDAGTRANYWGELFTQAIQQACLNPYLPTQGQCFNAANTDRWSFVCGPLRDPLAASLESGTSLVGASTPYGTITHSKVTTRRDTRSGKAASPTAGGASFDSQTGQVEATGAPAIMQLHAPMTTITVDWIVERLNAYPILPSQINNDPNYVAIGTPRIVNTDPYVFPDGDSAAYHVEGTYYYVLKEADQTNPALPQGTNPGYTLTFEDNILPNDIYVHGMIDPGQLIAGPFGGPIGPQV
jgi:hypothetical protein